MKRLTAMVSALLIVALPLIANAGTFTVHLDQQTVRDDPGTTVQLASVNVPDDLIGQVCQVTAVEAGNNRSVHPGNNIVVVSAGQVTLLDVEREAGATTGPVGPLTLGSTLTADLVLGPDGVYSADLMLTLNCRPPATSTTTSSTTTSSTTTSTVPEEPTVEVEAVCESLTVRNTGQQSVEVTVYVGDGEITLTLGPDDSKSLRVAPGQYWAVVLGDEVIAQGIGMEACPVTTTTPTTTPSTSTTAPPTTIGTTTTTEPPVSTTAPSTTVPEDTTTSTTPVVTVPPTTPSTLPRTGADTRTLLASALSLLVLGGLTLKATGSTE